MTKPRHAHADVEQARTALGQVATALGLVPNFWHTRRIPLLAVLVVPVCLNMAGVGSKVAGWLGFR